MPEGIVKDNGIIPRIRIPLERLRIGRTGYKGVRSNKSAQNAVMVPGFIKVKIRAAIKFLARVLVSHIVPTPLILDPPSPDCY